MQVECGDGLRYADEPAPGGAIAGALHREAQVLLDREMREQPPILEYVADAAAVRGHAARAALPERAVERDVAACGFLEAGDHAQQSGLARRRSGRTAR